MSKEKGRIGSGFEEFLEEEGTLEESQAIALKRIRAWQLERERDGPTAEANPAPTPPAPPPRAPTCEPTSLPDPARPPSRRRGFRG